MSRTIEIENHFTDVVDNGSIVGDSSASARRRSKSASEKNFNLPRIGDSIGIKTDLNETSESVVSTSSCRTSPIRRDSCSIKKDGVSNHRASLEKDVIRLLLFELTKRLFNSSLAIEQLQMRLQQEKSMRLVLEKAMGRASSMLSPGHHHFAAQTKELIAEIELLEEEVTNREQHVLSLYRGIFHNCVSRTASEQSSVVTSPAHAKSESRKHPSIISSAFCSSKNFPLRKLHSLPTVNDSGKKGQLQSRTRYVSLLHGKDSIYFEEKWTSCVKAPITSKTSIPRTLKDHIYQCPSKLAEEMVRCMASVYYWLRNASSSKTKEIQTSSSLKSSTGAILQRDVVDRNLSNRSTVEIPWISTDRNNFSRASSAINHYRVLVEQLEKVNVRKMDLDAQIAFWINLYNSLVMHAYLAFGIPQNSFRRLALFHKASYNIGGFVISANTIEQSIFCYRTPRLGQWLETVLSTTMGKKSGEERKVVSSKFGLQIFQPLVCFALCTGAYSDPLLNAYTAANIKEELEAAKREFLQANIVIKKSKNILLPKLIEKYSKEASIPGNKIVEWVVETVDNKLRDLIQTCVDGRPRKRASQIIKWLPFNSRFRYVFSKELTQWPCRF